MMYTISMGSEGRVFGDRLVFVLFCFFAFTASSSWLVALLLNKLGQ